MKVVFNKEKIRKAFIEDFKREYASRCNSSKREDKEFKTSSLAGLENPDAPEYQMMIIFSEAYLIQCESICEFFS